MIVDADCHISPLKEGVNIAADESVGGWIAPAWDKALVSLTPP